MQIVSADEKSAMSKQDMIQVIQAYVEEARMLDKQGMAIEDKQQGGVDEDEEPEDEDEGQRGVDEDEEPEDEDEGQRGVDEDEEPEDGDEGQRGVEESETKGEERGIGDSIFTLYTSVCMKQMMIKKSVC